MLTCDDPDGGRNVFEKATTCASWTEGYSHCRTDYCQSNGNVLEFYCVWGDNSITGSTTSCDSGYVCSDGACVLISMWKSYC